MRSDGASRRLRWRRRLAAAAIAGLCATAAVGCSSTGYDATGTTHGTAAVAAALDAVRSGHCPAEVPDKPASDVGGNGELLKPIVPDRMLLCGYVLEQTPIRTLVRGQAVVTDAALLRRLRSGIDQLKPFPSGPMSCPDDTGGNLLEIYTDGHHVLELTETLTGCTSVSDGAYLRFAGPSDIGQTLVALLPAQFRHAIGH